MSAVSELLNTAVQNAQEADQRVISLLGELVDLMEQREGHEWRIQVDYEAGFILLARLRERRA